MNKGLRCIWSLLGLAAAWMLERQIERSQPRAPRPARSVYEPRGEDPCVPTRLHGQTVVQTDLGPRRTANPTSLVIFVNLILPESWQHFSPRSLVYIHSVCPGSSDPLYIVNLHIYEKLVTTSWTNSTICPRSSIPFYLVNYYIKWVTTPWE